MKPKVRFKGYVDKWEKIPFKDMVMKSSVITTDDSIPSVEYEDIISKEGRLNKDIHKKTIHKTGQKFNTGDVLFGKLRPYLGNNLLADFDGIAVGDFWIFKEGLTITEFLYPFLYSREFDYISNISTGSKMPRSDWQLISTWNFNIPLNKNEQKAIGEFFRKLDELIRDTGKEIEKLENLKQASLQKMFPQPGESIPQLRFKGFSEPWHEKSLGEISFINKGEQVNKNQLLESGPYYMLNGGIEPSGYFDKFNTKGHTISISEGGNSCGYVFFNEKAFWSGGHNYTVIPNIPDIDNIFLYYFLKGKELDIMSKRVGSGLPNIQRSSLLEYQISFPSSYEEQRAIGDYFRNLDNIISVKKKKLEKLRQVKSSCLNLMFV